MENSIENIRAVSLYLLIEEDYGQVESLNQTGKQKFDAWEMEAFLAYAIFKTGQIQRAKEILTQSSYSKNPDINKFYSCLLSIFKYQKTKLKSLKIGKGDCMIF